MTSVRSSQPISYICADLPANLIIDRHHHLHTMALFHRQHGVCHLLVSLLFVCLWKRRNAMAWSPLRSVYRALQRRRNVVTFPSDTNTTTIHNYFMDMALQQAEKAARIGEVPIGAIVVRSMQTIHHHQAIAITKSCREPPIEWKRRTMLPLMPNSSPCDKHPRRIRNWRLLNTTLYSTLEPCPMCLAACQSFRVHQIVYGAPDLRLGAIETHLQLLDVPHPFHNISTVIKDVHSNESKAMLQAFFQRRRQESKTQKQNERRNAL